MERDFLGLNSNSKEPLSAVKREITEEESQWPFIKKASSFSQFMSLRSGAGQDGEMNKMNFSLPANNPYAKPNFSSSGHNVEKAITRQQFQGVSMTVTSPLGPVGFTEPWNNSNPVTAPAQMTIFYAGTVNVYDGITPEKAQAIMLLAGNGSFLASNASPPGHTKVQSPLIKANLQSSKDEQGVTNTNMVSSAPVSMPEHQRVAASRGGPVSMPAMVPSALPQFRKASLARFLEKRKERVMSTGPYACEKKQEGIFSSNNNTCSAMPLAM